jgi:hypothetical protein
MAVSTITPGPTLSASPPTSHGPLGRLGLWTAAHFKVLLIVWAIVAVGLGAFAPRVGRQESGPLPVEDQGLPARVFALAGGEPAPFRGGAGIRDRSGPHPQSS